MKRFFGLILILAPFFSFAQQTQGEITFEETVKLNIQLPPDAPEEMKARIPKERTFPKHLYFNAQNSLYKDAEITAEEGPGGGGSWQGHGGGGGGMRMRFGMMRPQNSLYKNIAEGEKVEQRDFMDKKFLIEDQIQKYNWKIAMEQKQIGDYLCQKAIHTDTSGVIVAWFAPQIPVSTGPGNLGGLPGMILEADIHDGETIIKVKEIKLGEVDLAILETPTKGKKVTEEEFDEIRRAKIEEMREEMGGQGAPGGHGGNMIIIRQSN